MSLKDQLEANLRARTEARLENARTILVELIREPLPEITGQLRAGIQVDPWQGSGERYDTTVRSLAPYSMWYEQGTGEFGPLGGRIYPTSARVLHFYWYARGGWYSFASVRGSPPHPYFHEPMPTYYADALVRAA